MKPRIAVAFAVVTAAVGVGAWVWFAMGPTAHETSPLPEERKGSQIAPRGADASTMPPAVSVPRPEPAVPPAEGGPIVASTAQPALRPLPVPDPARTPVTAARPVPAARPPVVPEEAPQPVVDPEEIARAMVEVDKVGLMLRDYRTLMGENPWGTNTEIMKAVMGGNPKKAQLGPPEGQVVNGNGDLVDRWGTPYFFHQLSSTNMEVRSAGPDRILWTDDDLIRN